MVEKLKEDGWKVITTSFGECLLMPKEQREQIIPAIADALIDWHITSNQARTFSLMETLAIAISDNANTLAAAKVLALSLIAMAKVSIKLNVLA